MNKFSFTCLLGAFSVLTGCAGMPATLESESAIRSAVQPAYVLQFKSQEVRRQLIDIGLAGTFESYWSAYVARDWVARYRMEEFQRPVEESFYLAYHAAAWRLLGMSVDAVDVADAPDRVRISLRAHFRNPDRPDEERTTFLQDLWTKQERGWLHVNSDPMLNGLRSVK